MGASTSCRSCCLLLSLLLVTCCTAAAGTPPPPAVPLPFASCSFPDAAGAVQRFSRVLSFKTVSDATQPGGLADPQEFEALTDYLQEAYPTVWRHLTVERVGQAGSDGRPHSLLLTWPGADPALRPALFISHLDVVPVPPETAPNWSHPPFGGVVADGLIYGRGALDVKNGVVGLLEAAAALLAQGYQPQRTLLLAFGQDEETGGLEGAAQIAALLASRLAGEGRDDHHHHPPLEFILDEGGTVYAAGMPPFTRQPLALVATAEKFYHTVALTLHSPGGHSSMPPTDTSSMAARLGRLLSGLAASPPRPRMVSPTRELMAGLVELGPAWMVPLRLLWRLAPRQVEGLLAALMAAVSAPTAALVRDTAAMTLVKSGVADNVLPQVAEVSINFRLLPGTPIPDAARHVLRWLGPDAAHANLTLLHTPFQPSRVTDAEGPAFQVLKAAIQRVWRWNSNNSAAGDGRKRRSDGSRAGDLSPVPVLPYLMPGGTDSKHYQNLTDAILRFSPLYLRPEDLGMIHGTNERMSVENFELLLCTYREVLRLAGAGSTAGSGQPAAQIPDAPDEAAVAEE